jgi:hypothetical protein
MSATLIAGGALLVSFVALVLAVVSNFRGYSLHQRQLDLERRMSRLEEKTQPADRAE